MLLQNVDREAIERFYSACIVNVDHGIELIWQLGVEIVTAALRFGLVDDAAPAFISLVDLSTMTCILTIEHLLIGQSAAPDTTWL